MKKALLLFPMLMLACAQGPTASDPTGLASSAIHDDDHGDEGTRHCADPIAEVLALDDRFRDAVVAADVSTLNVILSEDLVYTNPNGGVFNKADGIASTERGDFRVERIDLLNRVVRLHGTAVVVTGDRVLVNAFFHPPTAPPGVFIDISGTYRYSHTYMQTSFGHGGDRDDSRACRVSCPSTWQLVSQNLTRII